MIRFTVGNYVQQSVNVILNSNKVTSPITILGKVIICSKEDISNIKTLLKRKEIRVKTSIGGIGYQ